MTMGIYIRPTRTGCQLRLESEQFDILLALSPTDAQRLQQSIENTLKQRRVMLDALQSTGDTEVSSSQTSEWNWIA